MNNKEKQQTSNNLTRYKKEMAVSRQPIFTPNHKSNTMKVHCKCK